MRALVSRPDGRAPAWLASRVIWVLGKGGVGKSTVAAALAGYLAGRARSPQVVLVRLADRGLSERSPLVPGVRELAVDGESALAEYLSGVLPRTLHRRVVRSDLYARFVAIAPGVKELLAIGKIYDLARRRDHGGLFSQTTVVVDAPSTGHGLAVLRMPDQVLRTFGEGLVAREAQRLTAELTRPDTSAICVVTRPAALPTHETLELVDGLGELGLDPAAVVLNAIHDAPAFAAGALSMRVGAPPLVARALAAGRRRARLVERERAACKALVASLPQTMLLELPALAGREPDAGALRSILARQLEATR